MAKESAILRKKRNGKIMTNPCVAAVPRVRIPRLTGGSSLHTNKLRLNHFYRWSRLSFLLL